MIPNLKFIIKFEMRHEDTISGIKQYSVSSYEQGNVSQQNLPTIIKELNDKGYGIVAIRRSTDPDRDF